MEILLIFVAIVLVCYAFIKISERNSPKNDGIIRPWWDIAEDRIDEQKDKRAKQEIKKALEEEKRKHESRSREDK